MKLKKKNHFTLIIIGNRNLNKELDVCIAFESSARKGTIQLNIASMRGSLKLIP